MLRLSSNLRVYRIHFNRYVTVVEILEEYLRAFWNTYINMRAHIT